MFKHYYRILFIGIVMALVTACSGQPASDAAAGPRFSHPTDITNAYYPVSLAGQAIFVGAEDGTPARNEVTLLPSTKIIDLGGQQVEARISQFVAYSGGKLVEVAYDYFAQADDGGVYYLGEDVSNYANGQVSNQSGSWLAGKNGAPAALIMPAHPQVGQKFNPENLPGVVFERDEILSITEKVTTPAGPINDGILVKETLMEGTIEHKVYAANFGIVLDRGTNEELKLVLFNRTGAKPGSVPGSLSSMEAQAEDIMDVVRAGNWEGVSADVAAIQKAWQEYQTQAASKVVPQPFQDSMAAAIDRLQKTLTSKDTAGALQAANDLSAAIVDHSNVYRPATPADLGALDVLERQVLLDEETRGINFAADSLAKMNAVWARLKPVILAQHGADAAQQFENSLAAQQAALSKKDGSALTDEANHALGLVDVLEKLF